MKHLTGPQRKMKFAALLAGILFAAATAYCAEPYSGKVLWGLSTRNVKVADVAAAAGLVPEGQEQLSEITIVTPGATGEAEGLRAGDYFLSINHAPPDQFNISNVSGSRNGTLQVGDPIQVKVLRITDGKPQVLELELKAARYYDTAPREYVAPEGAREFAGAASTHQEAALPIIAEQHWDADFADLMRRLAEVDAYQDPYRLPLFGYLVRNPFALEAVTRAAIARVKAAANDGSALLGVAEWLFRFAPPTPPEGFAIPEFGGGDLNAHLDYIESVLKMAAEYNRRAFQALSPEERDFVLQHRNGLLDSFLRYKMLSYEPDSELTRRNLALCKLLTRIDYAPLYAQAQLAAALTGDRFTASLRQAAPAAGDAAVIARRDTPYGRIVIAGTGDNIHNEDCAALYDLGGNDVYFNNQAGSIPTAVPTAILVDFDGCDSYESTDPLTQGSGNFGVGILRDLAGDDTYIGIREVQGTAFAGIGLLLDEAGNDTYRALDTAQAVAFFGAGILGDRSGNDRYEAHQAAQGVGSTGGIGILSDLAGSDTYYCKGGQQTGYDTRGHYEGWSQGMGFGLRPYASGGIGILYDGAGADRYEAGTFSQGGGYYYAFGILADDGAADDNYLGTRYAQGFGVHQAVGAFVEAGGNDTYRTRHCVAQGLAWDESIGLFLDEAGNDRYNGGEGFSLGAVSHNGLCFFLDRAGDDVYAGPQPTAAADNSYHGGSSLSVFIDDGGGKDSYPGRADNTVVCGPKNSIFIDR